MRRVIGKALVAALAIVATTVAAGTSRADAIKGYEIIDLGSRDGHPSTYQPMIDNDGKLVDHYPEVGGDYIFEEIRGSYYYYGRNQENYLHLAGNHPNLLPMSLRDPSSLIISKNILGHVLAPRVVGDGNAYFFAPESNQLVPLKWLPGALGMPTVYAMNDRDQIVGEQDGHAIFYASPTSDPVILDTLLDQPSGWRLMGATGINNRGEIVGPGLNPEGSYNAFLLEPIATPEPTTLMMSAVLGTAWIARNRLRHLFHKSPE